MQAAWIGWSASIILLLTLGRQVYVQWSEKNTNGVSAWLFAGQVLASIGFISYSYLVHDRIFILTNSAILLTSLVGQCVYIRNIRLETSSKAVQKS